MYCQYVSTHGEWRTFRLDSESLNWFITEIEQHSSGGIVDDLRVMVSPLREDFGERSDPGWRRCCRLKGS